MLNETTQRKTSPTLADQVDGLVMYYFLAGGFAGGLGFCSDVGGL